MTIQERIEELRGTCDSFDDIDDFSQAELEELDGEIFCCDTCGWWCEISEAEANDGGQDICGDCVE